MRCVRESHRRHHLLFRQTPCRLTAQSASRLKISQRNGWSSTPGLFDDCLRIEGRVLSLSPALCFLVYLVFSFHCVVMLRFNYRLRPYRNLDTCCYIVNAVGIPRVRCFDMETLERLPVPLVRAWSSLRTYVLSDEPESRQHMFSGRPIRFCKALISLIMSRVWSSHG